MLDKHLIIINPMWPTDEYAIRAFRSVWRMHIVLVMMAPMIAIEINVYEIKNICFLINIFIRLKPYLPNFNSTAASTIDPATGALTWALGNHMWIENKGNLTINAIINICLLYTSPSPRD